MRKHAGTGRTRWLRVAIVLAVCAAILALYLGRRAEPPDLSACTRIEVRYADGALNYFFPSTAMQGRMLNEAEKEYVRSYDTWTVTDQDQIKAFAHQIGRGSHRGWVFGFVETRANIVGYRHGGRKISFSVTGGPSIITPGRRTFSYEPDGVSLASLDPPEIKPLQTRWICAENLYHLYRGSWPSPRSPRPYLDPDHWCNTIVELSRRSYFIYEDLDNKEERVYPDTIIAGWFTCPSAHAPADENGAYSHADERHASDQNSNSWISDYAMNSNCDANSPRDMVLFFESRPGWNQHGGPELFTFDNHDPRGGCVLLNDGTVKFIRTEEELHALRWR